MAVRAPAMDAWAQPAETAPAAAAPTAKVDGLAAEVAGLRLGQERLTARVDSIAAIQANQGRAIRQLEAVRRRISLGRGLSPARTPQPCSNCHARWRAEPGREGGIP